MNILLLNDRYPPRYESSVASITYGLAEQYKKLGHKVTVLTSHRKNVSKVILREEHVISLPVEYRPSLRHYKSLRQKQVSAMLEEEIKRIAPDVVHAHNLHMYLTYDALRIAATYAPKVFITMHDVMSFHYGRLATGRYLASGGEKVHTNWFDHLDEAGLQWNPLRNKMILRALGHVTRVIAVSTALKKALDAHGIPRTCVVQNGIDIASWRATEQEAADFRRAHALEGKKVVLFGGRLSRDKGSTPLLHALSVVKETVPTVRLVVIGDPGRWAGLVQEAGVGSEVTNYVQCIDWLPKEKMRAAYAACDVVTTPSLCLDTFNLMNAEAMANSKPVVGTCFGGTPEVVEDGVTGYVCNPLKEKEYANLLSRLLKDPELAHKMGRAGKQRVEELFTVERQAEKYVDLYGMQ
ncbi:hypothetical protein COU76_02065 [Candidatus Peregrinibacteria bacterium CG10_big_fil_rev_8_21_14_0_10_49_10]|nr:MAG: hypothetical protein COU76_02065 [Candidatus Peregrinibacteria bacterium CG10_big_fil_rev_8_21_14_0_10_49_10]